MTIGGGARRARLAASGGFTLLEILVAVLILAVAYLAVLENFSVSFRNLEKLERAWRQDFRELSLREPDLRAPVETDVKPPPGELLVAGARYQLVLVKSAEAPRQATVLLERRQ